MECVIAPVVAPTVLVRLLLRYLRYSIMAIGSTRPESRVGLGGIPCSIETHYQHREAVASINLS